MSFANKTAIVAPVVSLITLLVAVGQLSQQTLGTAEGYRECDSSVISIRITRPSHQDTKRRLPDERNALLLLLSAWNNVKFAFDCGAIATATVKEYIIYCGSSKDR